MYCIVLYCIVLYCIDVMIYLMNICKTKLPSDIEYKSHQALKHECFSSRLAVVSTQFTEAKCLVENEYIVGAVPTGDTPTTAEWSSILFSTKLRIIFEIWRYVLARYASGEFDCWIKIWNQQLPETM